MFEYKNEDMKRILEEVMDLRTMITIVLCVLTTFMIRVWFCLPRSSAGKSDPVSLGLVKTVKTMVYFGSGGHTMEMIRLINNLDPSKYR